MTEFEMMTESVIKKLIKPLEAKIDELEADLTALEEVVRNFSVNKKAEAGDGATGGWWHQQFVYPPSLETPPTRPVSPDAVVQGQSVLVTDVK